MLFLERLKFVTSDHGLGESFAASYDWFFVLLSYLVICLAAFTGIKTAPLIQTSETRAAKIAWLGLGAFCLGCGIWSMHFIGMLAYHIPIPISYDLEMTVLSFLPAMAVSGPMLFVIARPSTRRRNVVAMGAIFGIGVAMMHFAGMEAMTLNGVMLYDPVLFIFSIVGVMGLAILALLILNWGDTRFESSGLISVFSALLIGGAVAGMHYTAMAGLLTFPADAGQAIYVPTIDEHRLAVATAITTIGILAITGLVAFFETRVKAAVRETRVSRSRLIDAVESMSDGFALFDANRRLILYNSNYDRMVNRLPEELSIGTSFEEIIRKRAHRVLGDVAGEDKEEWVQHRLGLFSRADGIAFERYLANGRWHRISHQRTSEGGTVVIRSDITDAKRRERELIDARKYEAVGRLAGGTAHEFNNLLMAILGSLHLMRQRIKDDEKLLAILERAWASSRRAADLINGIVSYAQQQFLRTEKVDVVAAVDGALSKTPLDLREDIHLRKDIAPGLRHALIDPKQLETALINVLLNAIEAIPSNGEITIEARNVDLDDKETACPPGLSQGRYVSLTVTDTGIGMDPDTLEKAPEPFFTTKEIGQGTGLGLSMVHGFVKQSGGQCSLESAKGRGTKVTFLLPVYEDALPEQQLKIA